MIDGKAESVDIGDPRLNAEQLLRWLVRLGPEGRERTLAAATAAAEEEALQGLDKERLMTDPSYLDQRERPEVANFWERMTRGHEQDQATEGLRRFGDGTAGGID